MSTLGNSIFMEYWRQSQINIPARRLSWIGFSGIANGYSSAFINTGIQTQLGLSFYTSLAFPYGFDLSLGEMYSGANSGPNFAIGEEGNVRFGTLAISGFNANTTDTYVFGIEIPEQVGGYRSYKINGAEVGTFQQKSAVTVYMHLLMQLGMDANGTPNNNQRNYGIKGVCHGAQYMVNGTLERNFIPMLWNAGATYTDGNSGAQVTAAADKPGMYDTVSGRFFTNRGTGADFLYQLA